MSTQSSEQLAADFAVEVRRDLALAPKQLQSKYLYDALGSSLFEAICRLPWYRITRAEQGLLEQHARTIGFCGHLRPLVGRVSVKVDPRPT